jgi:circadian clock protein KaiB
VRYEFTLFVGGKGGAAQRAEADVEAMCEIFLDEPYGLAVVDVADDPDAAAAEEISVLPTLIRRRPAPERRVLGDLGDAEALARALRLDLAGTTGSRRV